MKSFAFPKMLSNSSSNIIEDHEASVTNTKLALLSWKKTFFCDPYYGSNLRKLFFDQNNSYLQDIVIDDICTTINTFIPQLRLSRKDVSIVSEKDKIYIYIQALNLLDYSLENISLNLLTSEE